MMFVSEHGVYADKVHKSAPPPWRMFDAVVHERDRWLRVRDREVDPGVIKAERPDARRLGLAVVSPEDTSDG